MRELPAGPGCGPGRRDPAGMVELRSAGDDIGRGWRRTVHTNMKERTQSHFRTLHISSFVSGGCGASQKGGRKSCPHEPNGPPYVARCRVARSSLNTIQDSVDAVGIGAKTLKRKRQFVVNGMAKELKPAGLAIRDAAARPPGFQRIRYFGFPNCHRSSGKINFPCELPMNRSWLMTA